MYYLCPQGAAAKGAGLTKQGDIMRGRKWYRVGNASLFKYERTRTLMGKLDYGCDLLSSLQEFCQKEDIKLGVFSAMGAVKKAAFSFYDQASKTYKDKLIEEELEIVSCSGNISLRDGLSAIHAHAVFSDREGRTCGGHLIKGTIVFSCELFIQELEGEPLMRAYDETTGLPLWRM